MIPKVRNLFTPPDPQKEGEIFRKLLEGKGFRMESIASHGAASPEGYWYDQPEPEWVLLLRGSARLAFEKPDVLELRDGDYLLIPAHLKHRVEWVSEDALWLAMHIAGDELKSDNAEACNP